MNEVTSWVGAVTGIVSLILILYYIAVWKGKTDTKVDTLWNIYVMDALQDNNQLIQHHSPVIITKLGEDEIPVELQVCIDDHMCRGKNYGYEVIQCLGMDKVQKFAQDKGWSVQRSLGLLALYMKKVQSERGSCVTPKA
jgi:hypothetical protein